MSSPARHARDVYSVAQLLVHVLKRPDYNMGMIGINRAKTADTFPFMEALQALPADHKRMVVRFFNSMLDDGTGERTKAEVLLRAPFFSPKRRFRPVLGCIAPTKKTEALAFFF